MLIHESASNKGAEEEPSEALHHSGETIEAAPGTLACIGCGFSFPTTNAGSLPECPNCGGTDFRRAPLFGRPTIDTAAIEVSEATPAWLAEVRRELDPGRYLAFEDEGERTVREIKTGWTRIGRSITADLCLNDATVSRRHALLVLNDQGELKALDDRSLNGLFINGERVDWATLSDGDELEVGRFRLHVCIV